jgi:hypothetical protein
MLLCVFLWLGIDFCRSGCVWNKVERRVVEEGIIITLGGYEGVWKSKLIALRMQNDSLYQGVMSEQCQSIPWNRSLCTDLWAQKSAAA